MSGGNRKKPVEMVGADSIQEKQRYLGLSFSVKPSHSYFECF